MSKGRRYAYPDAIAFLEDLVENGYSLEWAREKMKVEGRNSAGDPFEFRMPWSFPLPEAEQSLEAYLEDVPYSPPPYLLVLIQAGHSAMGYFEDGEVMHHKVIKKYMVRAGQGKAQIGYLSTRGKSKAGSRIRLANSVRFFEDINEKISEWCVADEVERILVSCPIRLMSLWFGSKTPPPFERDDPRFRKIPLDVHRPDHEELLRVNRVGLGGYLMGEI